MPTDDLTDEQRAILLGSQESRLVATPFYDGVQTDDELPVTDGTIEDDGDALVPRSGSLTVASPDGRLIPRTWSDPLSPFGSQLFIESHHELAGASTRIPIGWFRVEELPNYTEHKDRYRSGEWVHRGALIQVKLLGLLADVNDDEFEATEQGPAGASTWDELRRILRFPLTETLPDRPLSASLIYDTNRLQAAAVLAENLGGIPFETPDGTWSVRPKTAGEVQWDLDYGTAGGVAAPPRSLSRKDFHNVFISRNEDAGDALQVQGRAAIEDGPLRAGGPMHYSPYKHANPLLLTSAAAQKDAETYRRKASRGKPFQVSIDCLPNEAVVPGDVVRFDAYDDKVPGRVAKSVIRHNKMQTLTLDVEGGSSPWA